MEASPVSIGPQRASRSLAPVVLPRSSRIIVVALHLFVVLFFLGLHERRSLADLRARVLDRSVVARAVVRIVVVAVAVIPWVLQSLHNNNNDISTVRIK